MSKARSLADLGNAYDDGALSNRNLIINGAMQVAQRGTQTGHASGYTLDRWNVRTTGSARFTVSQDTDVPSGQGFGSSIKIDVTTADTDAGTGDFGAFRTILEGQNVQHICKGTSAAKKLTLSFWVKSTVTGTYTTELYDADNSRQVSLSYNVDTSDTWEQKVLVFPADTVGAFTNDANGSLYIQFGLAMGSDYSGGTLSTTWTVSNGPDRFAGQVNAFSSTSNNIYFTGVQLEQGDTATPFEHRSYGQELALCQRYYEVGSTYIARQNNDTLRTETTDCQFSVTKRSAPTMTNTNSSSGNVSVADITASNINSWRRRHRSTSTNDFSNQWNWKADAEL